MAASEFDLIASVADALRGRHAGVLVGIGDDAAVLEGGLCATVDLLIDGVHFRRETYAPEDVGWKGLAVSLSDLAAMGADPVAALVGLGVPHDVRDAEVRALMGGLDACAAEYGTQVAGGDVVRAPALSLSVTALGTAERPATREGAKPGDVLAVTGTLGGSRAGLALLGGLAVDVPEADALRQRHLRPRPRLAEGKALAGCAHALMDISDGLASDAERLAAASGVACHVDLDALPAQAGVAAVAAALGVECGWYAAAGGEDYELLAALPAAAVESCGVALTVVGEVREGPAGTVTYGGAGCETPPAGWDHRRH